MQLPDGDVTPVAEELIAAGIPFLLTRASPFRSSFDATQVYWSFESPLPRPD